jgi:hypothetical protein
LHGYQVNPRKRPRDEPQAMIDSQWYANNLWAEVQEQDCIGSLKFHTIEVWKNTVSEFTSKIIKDEKDFRRLMFRDVDKQVERGTYYFWDGNYYMVYEGNQPEDAYPEVLVRRCNNILKWIDKDTGSIIEMPCVLDYEISSTTPKINKDVMVAFSSVTLVVQGNKWTHNLKPNQRFIFNGICYKFIAINNYMQNSYVDKDTTILFIDIDADPLKPTDNLDLGIADYNEHHYEVQINNAPSSLEQGDTGTLYACALYNGQQIPEPIIKWQGDKNITIDNDGNYTVLGEEGEVGMISASYGDSFATIEIVIGSSDTDIGYDIIIEPPQTVLYEQQSCTYNITPQLNGQVIDELVDISVSGAASKCYTIELQDNQCTVTNLQRSKEPLVLTFTFEDVEKSLEVQLKSLF